MPQKKSGLTVLSIYAYTLVTCETLQVFPPHAEVTALLHSDAQLPCVFIPTSPQHGLKFIIPTWRRGRSILSEFKHGKLENTSRASMVQSELKKFNASLLLKQVTIEDEGEYTCEVSETMLETATARVTLKVVALPTVFLKPSLKIPNRPSTLECHVQHFYPRNITIEWVKDSMPLLHQRPLQIEQNGDQTFSTVNRYLYFHETKDVAANISCRVKHESLDRSVKEIPLQICQPNITSKMIMNGDKWQAICQVDDCHFSNVTVRLKKKETMINESTCNEDTVCATEVTFMKSIKDEEDKEELFCEVEFEGIDKPITERIVLIDQGGTWPAVVIALSSVLLLLIIGLVCCFKERLMNFVRTRECTNCSRPESVPGVNNDNSHGNEQNSQPTNKPTSQMNGHDKEENIELLKIKQTVSIRNEENENLQTTI